MEALPDHRCGVCAGLPRFWVLAVLLVALAVPARTAEVSFSKDVLPILKEKCFQCHGEGTPMSNLDLRTRETMLKGGQRGPGIVPGNASESRIYLHTSGMEGPVMPMGGSLTDEQILTLKDWIDEGAKWDLETAAKTETDPPAPAAKKPAEITLADREWWAFQKPVRPPMPQVSDARWSRHPVDAFIFEKLEEKGLKPAPPADRRTLIRRAYLDLIGLLPSPAEVEAFVNDRSPHAFEKVIDGLLASFHYGERWGRHWLDVARYADSGGYEHDYDYPNAWRYRDYVIKAFNEDKPYDQFIREQLAGDELDKTTYDSVTATGFLRVGPTVGFREKDNPQYRYTYLDDMIATTSRGIMALSVDCARCHDHKFDPIPQLDYYRMMAVFFPFVKYDHPLVPPGQAAAYEARRAEIEARVKLLREQIAAIEAPYKKIAFEERLKEFPEDIQIAVRTPESERTEGQKLLAEQILSIGPGSVTSLLRPEDRAQVEQLKEQIKEIEKGMPEPIPMAMGVRDGDYRFAPDGPGDQVLPGKGEREFYDFEGTFLPEPGKPYTPPAAHLLPTGDHLNKGPEVRSGFLRVIAAEDTPTALPPANGHISTGRRRALAEWLVSEDHPLTARVIVNRIWSHHFGRGIVTTASNFGRMGQLPSHPELLDWLATEFVRRGWSIKAMHRLIMTSQAYQMASSYDSKENLKLDPGNRFFWRYPQRRLEAEAVRDIILAASGQLNPEAGGEPFFPPLPESVWRSFGKGKWNLTQEGPKVWRRSVYSYWKRGLSYPMFEVFDQPNPNVTCERRNTTTVPTQALTLLNNEFVLLQAKHFAERVRNEAGEDPAAQVKRMYQIALSRDPGPEEQRRNVEFLEQQRAYHQLAKAGSDAHLKALTDLCDVVLNLNEFVYIN